eukprot:541245_1
MRSKTSKKSLATLLKHYAHSNGVNIDKCMKLVSKISTTNKSLTKTELKRCKGHLRQIIFRCNDFHSLKQIHSSIDSAIIQTDEYINATLITCYGKYSNVRQAFNIYNCIKHKDAKIVKAMMLILIQHNQIDKALSIYNKFNDFSDDSLNIIAIKAYSQTNQFSHAKNIIYKSKMKMNHNHMPSKTVLIDFYGKTGDINNALQIFSNIHSKQMNVFIIGSMMKAYNNNGYYKQSLQIYNKYEKLQNDLCHLLAIKACLYTNNFKKGTKIHSKIELERTRFQIEISTALIEFYGHFNEVDCAYNIFQLLHHKKRSDVVINTMMTALISNNFYQKALVLYDECKSNNNDILHLLALQTCINSDMYEHGKIIHDSIASKKINMKVKIVLIDFYGYFNKMDAAMKIFDSISDNEKTTVSVGAIMNGLINMNHNDKALQIYDKFSGLNDDVCHSLGIKACMNMNDLEKGKHIHNDLGVNITNIKLKNALISFYGNFGDIENAKNVFDSISDVQKDVVTFSAIMDLYCNANMNGEC